MNQGLIDKYLRKDKLPHIWCSGCGNGIILKALVEAIDASNINKEDICIVGGIGCSSRAAQYMNFDTIHTLHGRAIPYATGIKLANPKMKVIVISGDGDATAIGGNHLIHACRRNIDLTVIVFNNNIYGMTGGQCSPTTPKDARTTTSEGGNLCRDFDICKLCDAAGATYIARSTVAHYNHLVKAIEGAILRKGFSVVEALTTCPVQYGRRNKLKKPSDMIKVLKNGGAENEKLKIGVFKDENEDEYVEQYLKYISTQVII
ncbi:2-oxoacid:ferredoxin oxidoreductase subunit beta [Clostridium sp. FP2]|uniref:2-oxoacid:ferredoxin oxidoreductase subunit beta n=1 Tax=Clostridium TaxID=1485 RepID=UPI0013E93AD3|nr:MULTISPECIES: 2-oxoacid:ferredoxin oxidoreductase subunit beta [Clostridium]MBW9157314.1 2-oxoacid:ferredoxin oxidoreductase subunit beta [Clostridium tagluense]MBZ9623449.1 2-oxoacid:ferredoxin oxidoreductase subunit beta [Clostridium sp. FP2]WLC67615.1 2-oxoacid:ferredoxin oxidoreductase subunit beta [Clostridium tagluense]